MKIFDVDISDIELINAITRIYKVPVTLIDFNVDYHSQQPLHRLGLLNLTLQSSSRKILSLIVKECSKTELALTSLMNIILPYSSPRVVYYVESEKHNLSTWMLLENISTWVDLDGSHRIHETLLDGLYAIHRSFFNKTEMFHTAFPKLFIQLQPQLMTDLIKTTLDDISQLSLTTTFAEIFCAWDSICPQINKTLIDRPLKFTETVIHGSYYPNSVRGLRDTLGRTHVVAYDWINVRLGWPQIDLVPLLDRLDVIAAAQHLSSPSDILLYRYLNMMKDDLSASRSDFIRTYNFCYLYCMLPLIKSIMKKFMGSDQKDFERVQIELKVKLERLQTF